MFFRYSVDVYLRMGSMAEPRKSRAAACDRGRCAPPGIATARNMEVVMPFCCAQAQARPLRLPLRGSRAAPIGKGMVDQRSEACSIRPAEKQKALACVALQLRTCVGEHAAEHV